MITEYFINIALNLISTLGYPGVALVMFLESFMLPIPPEITVVFSGYLASLGKFNALSVVIWSLVGSLCGATLAYWIGFHFKKTIVQRIMEKHGHFLFFTEYELTSTKELFKKHGPWIILLTRFVPGIRSIVSLPMGILHIPFRQFITYTFVGSAVSIMLLTFVGFVLSENWGKIRFYLHKFDILFLFFLIMIISLYIYKRHKKKKV